MPISGTAGRSLMESSTERYDPDLGWVPGETFAVLGAFLNDTHNNKWRKGRSRYDGRDRGSSWTAVSSSYEEFPHGYICSVVSSDTSRGYRGPVRVGDEGFIFDNEHFCSLDSGFSSSEVQLAAYGTTAISRVIPTNPVADLPQAMAELIREGLPSAVGRRFVQNRSVAPSTLSDEYLNYQFGLKPFIADLVRFNEATKQAHKLVKQFHENSGKLYRRKFTFEPFRETVEFTHLPRPSSKGFIAGLNDVTNINMTPPFGGWHGERKDYTTCERRIWFSGAFTYHIKVPDDLLSKLLRKEAEIHHLYGGLSVDTAWNLLPYSWFADWITNAGDVIHNIAAFARDGLVMPYGYVMEDLSVTQRREVTGAVWGSSYAPFTTPLPPTLRSTYSVRYRRRRRATPYGFGLDPGEFTTRQKSILVALGLSRT